MIIPGTKHKGWERRRQRKGEELDGDEGGRGVAGLKEGKRRRQGRGGGRGEERGGEGRGEGRAGERRRQVKGGREEQACCGEERRGREGSQGRGVC